MDNTSYKSFPFYFLRTPVFSLDDYFKILGGENLEKYNFIKFCKDPVFQEAIFLASPSLYKKMNQWFISKDKITDKEKQRIRRSIIKYISRMTSRCTPFGMFAGVTTGSFGTKNKIVLEKKESFMKDVKFDMNFLVRLIQDVGLTSPLKEKLKFFPNNTIYEVLDEYRYIEFFYFGNEKRHKIVSTEKTRTLEYTIKFIRQGTYIHEIINFINSLGYEKNVAKHYVDSLIQNQVIKSELEPNLTGPEYLEKIIEILKEKQCEESILNVLDNQLKKLSNFNSIKAYEEITSTLKEAEINYDEKFLFRANTVIKTVNNELNPVLSKKVLKYLRFISYFTYDETIKDLKAFKEKFSERYGQKEVDLLLVLDNELGIGYGKSFNHIDGLSPLVDDLEVPTKKSKEKVSLLNPLESFILQKLKGFDEKKQKKLLITDTDFKEFEIKEQKGEFPDTISVLIEVFYFQKSLKLKIVSCVGDSAAKLLTRFCHSDKEVNKFVHEIIQFEENQIDSSAVLAEIVHLPEDRMGNVLVRPDIRNYEMLYLGESCKEHQRQIKLDDVALSLRNGKLYLRSKRLNKRIIPRLTSAHNFKRNSLPVYNFLCDLQNQDKRTNLGINLDALLKIIGHIPRIEYGEIIIQPASWYIEKKEIVKIVKCKDNYKEFEKVIESFMQEFNLPNLVLLIDGDNELLVNLKNIDGVDAFVDLIKKRRGFVLQEFLFTEKSLVQDIDGRSFTNQFIFPFFKAN